MSNQKITSMTVPEAAKELGLTAAGVYYLIGERKLEKTQGVRGRVVLVDAASVYDLKRQRELVTQEATSS